jgi:hypothetical protein
VIRWYSGLEGFSLWLYGIAIAFAPGVDAAFAGWLLLITLHLAYLSDYISRDSSAHQFQQSHTLQVMQPVRTLSFRIGRLTSGGVADIKKSSYDGLCKDVRTGYMIRCRCVGRTK